MTAAGKSFLLKRLISSLKAKNGANVFVTAATGIAATHIGGEETWTVLSIAQAHSTVLQTAAPALLTDIYT